VRVRFDSFELDAGRRQLFRDGRLIHMQPKAFDLLKLLVDAAPRVVAKSELHERLWPNGVVSDSTLVYLVKEIRRALGDRGRNEPMIRTAHRIGYAFDAPVTRAGTRAIPSRWLVAGERRIPLGDGEHIIGRDPEADVLLDYSTVSRRHARLVVSEAGAVLEDLGSKNGTTIGGTVLTAAMTLCNGDRFACGRVPLTYRESSAGMPTATQASRVGLASSRR
jgi:DNA-binding winged helix-turn-helix (wHTH) protein